MHVLSLDDYRIQLGPIGQSLPALLAGCAPSMILVLSDENTRRFCLPVVKPFFPQGVPAQVLEIPAGEMHKTLRTCERIWGEMLRAGADRNALLINLGGGVIGDMGGFCAATYKRGIDFIQVPTTLLSQVDASIGGKLGIDFGGIKNSVGVFRNPLAVCIDPTFLNTLPERELRSGFAEVIKHALIADAGQWKELQDGNPETLMKDTATILKSLEIKQAVVQADPYEKGWRKALNFGHTIGHAVEAGLLETGSPLLHGEAIAAGMMAEAYLSTQLGGLPPQDLVAICRYLTDIYTLPPLPENRFSDYVALMQNDKKNAGGRINCTLLEEPGRAKVDQFVSAQAIMESMRFYNNCLV